MRTPLITRLGPTILLALLAPGAAWAQEETSHVESSDGGGGGGGRGLGAIMEASFALETTPGDNPQGAAGLVYDLGQMRFGGGLTLAVVEGGATAFGLGANGWFALHRTRHADFSLSGGVGLRYLDNGPGRGNVRVTFIGGGQIRAFLVENVALTGTLGLGISFGEGGFAFGLGGQIAGALGLSYFF